MQLTNPITCCWTSSKSSWSKRKAFSMMFRKRIQSMLRQVPRFLYSNSCAGHWRTKIQPDVFQPSHRILHRMLSFQSDLPRLPVPPLMKTIEKYLLTVKPLVNEDEFRQTERIAKEFARPGGEGEKLQALLMARAEKKENWLSDWWLNVAYMDFRRPVVVYSSPALVGPIQTFLTKDDQLRCASKIIVATLEYKKLIDTKTLPVDYLGQSPLDMQQYFKILSTCRIPGEKRDAVEFYSEDKNPPKHIVVIRNNHFFKVNVYDSDGKPLSESQLFDQFKDIVSRSESEAPAIGILSSEDRNIWGRVYTKLCNDSENAKSVKEIQRSICVLCLDQPNPESKLDKTTQAAYQVLHGSNLNSGNRWFDKTVQYVVGTDGEVGITYEHSPSEGPPIANLFDFILRNLESKSTTSITSSGSVEPPKLLAFNLNRDLETYIQTAKADLQTLIKDLHMVSYVFKGYGTRVIKSQQLSPDSFIQTAMQLAFFRLHGEAGACYESASTRKYIHGRTETIRSATVDSLDMCRIFHDSEASDKEKAGVLKRAIATHKNYVNDAVGGFGVDRHLLGLKLISIEHGMAIPSFYLDTGYTRSSHFRLSTSQVSAKSASFMCYGPAVTDGYGCCYNPRAEEIIFGISSFNSCPDTSAEKFKDAMGKSLTDMYEVLARTVSAKL